ncbi:transposase, partial [[Clostridium] innocuum]|nr:transposase [[Clostridium] innocuum]
NVVMEKYNEMREDGSLFSWAESVEFAEQAVQANLEERTAEAEKLGLEKGLEKGKRTLLQTQIIHKYEIDDNWVNSLSDQQIDDAVILILKCDTYDDLKEKLKKNELK